MTDRVNLQQFAAGGDLDGVTDDRDLDLAAAVLAADPIREPGEAHVPGESTLRVTLWPTVACFGRGRDVFGLRANAWCSLAGR